MDVETAGPVLTELTHHDIGNRQFGQWDAGVVAESDDAGDMTMNLTVNDDEDEGDEGDAMKMNSARV